MRCVELEYDIRVYFDNNISQPYENEANKTSKMCDSFNELKRLYKKILNEELFDEQELINLGKETFAVLPNGFCEWVNKLKLLNIIKSKKRIAFYLLMDAEDLQKKKEFEIAKYSELIMSYEWLDNEFF